MQRFKHLLLVVCLFAVGNLAYGQTNLDFEDWQDTNNGNLPTGWTVSMDQSVEEITGGNQAEGQSSAKIKTISSGGNTVPGFIFQTGAFTERPAVINFDLRFDVQANDTAMISASLLSYDQNGESNLIGRSVTRVVGPAVEPNWQEAVNIFRYRSQDDPDSVQFFITSSSLSSAQAGSEISVDDITFCPKPRNTSRSYCNDTSQLDLINQLDGVALRGSIGTWIDVDNTGALNGDTLDLSQVSGGSYEFKYVTELPACASDTTTLNIQLIDPPSAGENNSVGVCPNDTVDLLSQLAGNPDTGGQWKDLDSTNALSNGQLNTSGLMFDSTYDFRYVTTNDSGCMDSAELLVSLTQSDAGKDTTIRACENTAAFDLKSQLGGNPDPGGTWTDTDNSGALNDSTVDLSQLTVDSMYQFTYLVSTNGCKPDTSVLIIGKEEPLYPGVSNSVSTCYNDTINLFETLNGNPERGGIWTDQEGNQVDSIFDASQVQDGMTYRFTYTLESNTGCQASSVATVSVAQEADAGSNTFAGAICETNDSLNLFSVLEGDPMPNGTWNDDNNSGAIDPNTGVLDGTQLTAGNSYEFTYTIADTCGGDSSATVTINAEAAPNAGEFNDTLKVCQSDDPVNLFEQLEGNPDEEGEFIDNSGGLDQDEEGNDIYNGASPVNPGVYTIQYLVAGSDCEDDTTFMTVEVEDCNEDFIGNEASEVDLNVYPNPAQNQVTFETDDQRASEIRIFDAKGGLVHQKAFDSEKVDVNVNGWSEGLYIYHLTGENGSILSIDKFTIKR